MYRAIEKWQGQLYLRSKAAILDKVLTKAATMNTPSADILQQFTQSVGQATDEVIELAQEDHTPLANAFATFAVHPGNREIVEGYVFELLKAFGCCALQISADDEHSRQELARLELAHPPLVWVKDSYRQGVPLGEINPELAADKQVLVLATERLEQWLS